MLTDKANIIVFLNDFFHIEGTYTISDDGVVDVDGNVILKSFLTANQLKLTELPIQFGTVTGDFKFKSFKITTLKGFPYTVGGYCEIDESKYLKSLEFSPKCENLICDDCSQLESLDGLNCVFFSGLNLNLKEFGTQFNCKHFYINRYPQPTADEVRHFISLKLSIDNDREVREREKEEFWLKILDNYLESDDLLKAAYEFEQLYQEPYVKSENKIDLTFDNNYGLSL